MKQPMVAITDGLGATALFSSPGTGQAGFTIASLNNAILFIEIERGKESCRGGFWLSTYGLGERFAGVRDQFANAYRSALELPREE